MCAVAAANTIRTCPKCEDVSPLNPSGSAVESAVLRTTPPSWTPTTYSGAPGLRACGERLCTARAQVKRPSRKSRAGQQQKPSEEIPMRLKTHKDSAGNLRPSSLDHPPAVKRSTAVFDSGTEGCLRQPQATSGNPRSSASRHKAACRLRRQAIYTRST